jgi:hypothetical protein
VSASIETARQEWEESHRRLEDASRDRARYERLRAQVDALTEELRKRVGQTFTLADLAAAYEGADRWAADALAGNADEPSWPDSLAVVEGSAFHLYARGAVDYAP